jgi:hypothetical protein
VEDEFDTELREALDDLVVRHQHAPVRSVHSVARRRTSGPRVRVTAVLVAAVAALASFGGGFALGHSKPNWPRPIRHVQSSVALAQSASCPVTGASLSITPSGPVTAGSTVTVTGPLYHQTEDGTTVVPADEDLQVWWGVDATDWTNVAGDAIAISQGANPAGSAMLGDDRPSGACSFTITFTVPTLAQGDYPVSILRAAGASGATLYASYVAKVDG